MKTSQTRPPGPSSARARQKGAAPTAFSIARPQWLRRVKAEATAKAEGAHQNPRKKFKTSQTRPPGPTPSTAQQPLAETTKTNDKSNVHPSVHLSVLTRPSVAGFNAPNDNWSTIHHELRQERHGFVRRLQCGKVFDLFTEIECRSYLRHCGYGYT